MVNILKCTDSSYDYQAIFSNPTVSLPMVKIDGATPTPQQEVIKMLNIRGLGVPLHLLHLDHNGIVWFKEETIRDKSLGDDVNTV